jgi:serine protease
MLSNHPRFALLSLAVSLLASTDIVAADEPASRYIVHFADDMLAPAAATTSLRAARKAGGVLRRVRTLASGGELIELSATQAERLAAQPGVLAVEEDLMLTHSTVTDGLFIRQWYMHDPRVGIDAEVAWKKTRGAGAVVAVLDTGVTPHPEFDGQLLPGWDFVSDAEAARDGDGRDGDPTDEGDWTEVGDCASKRASASSWHGTHVMGIVAARQGSAFNGVGVVGVAPEAKLVPVRVLARCGGRLSDVADAIVWASGGQVPGVPRMAPVDVINLSLGVPGACGTTLRRAISQARDRGTAIVVAAGNEGIKASATTPANCPGVVTVTALSRDGSMAWYANHGEAVTLAAPGGSLNGAGADDILSSAWRGKRARVTPNFLYYAGTSVAAPQVAGLVALMRSVDPAISVDDITKQLVDNARPLPGPCPKGCGAGLMDAGATVDAVVEDRVPPR